MESAALDCSDVVPQPRYAVFGLLHGVLPQRDWPIVPQDKSHTERVDRPDLDLAQYRTSTVSTKAQTTA